MGAPRRFVAIRAGALGALNAHLERDDAVSLSSRVHVFLRHSRESAAASMTSVDVPPSRTDAGRVGIAFANARMGANLAGDAVSRRAFCNRAQSKRAAKLRTFFGVRG